MLGNSRRVDSTGSSEKYGRFYEEMREGVILRSVGKFIPHPQPLFADPERELLKEESIDIVIKAYLERCHWYMGDVCKQFLFGIFLIISLP